MGAQVAGQEPALPAQLQAVENGNAKPVPLPSSSRTGEGLHLSDGYGSHQVPHMTEGPPAVPSGSPMGGFPEPEPPSAASDCAAAHPGSRLATELHADTRGLGAQGPESPGPVYRHPAGGTTEASTLGVHAARRDDNVPGYGTAVPVRSPGETGATEASTALLDEATHRAEALEKEVAELHARLAAVPDLEARVSRAEAEAAAWAANVQTLEEQKDILREEVSMLLYHCLIT